MTTQYLNKRACDSLSGISGKDADSVGIGEWDTNYIPFPYSEGAVDVR